MLTEDDRKTLKELILDTNGPDVYLKANEVTPIDLTMICSELGLDFHFSYVKESIDNGNPEFTLVPVMRTALAEREKNG